MGQSVRVCFDPRTTVFYLMGGLIDRWLAEGVTRENLEEEIKALYALGTRHLRTGDASGEDSAV